MDEIVKYGNEMNKLNFTGLTKVDMNILMALCSRMKNKGLEEIELTFDEIKELSNYTSTERKKFLQALDGMIRRLQKVNSKIITNDEICYFVLFPTFRVNSKTETVRIATNKDFLFLLNDLKSFTKFELVEFVELDSKYAKNLYRLLKQFRSTGKLVIDDVDDFRGLMDAPKSYELYDFKRFVLDAALKELREKGIFKNLTCEPQRARKRGRPVVGYIFTFEPESRANKKTVRKKLDETSEETSPAADEQPDELDALIDLIDGYDLGIGLRSALSLANKAIELGRGVSYVRDVLEIVSKQDCDNVTAKAMSLLIGGYDQPKKRKKPKTATGNFKQREYNMSDLEQQLLV